MSVHEQFADDLALYAIGALQGDDCVAVEAHLRECAQCRSELERLRGDAALLAFSTSGPRPPLRSRQRLLSAVTKEPRRVPVLRSKWKPWWSTLEWAAAAALLVVVFLLLHQNRVLRTRVGDLEAGSAEQQQQLQQAKQLMATLTASDAARYVLVAGNTPPQPQGKAIYVASSGTLVFLASNLPDLPPERAYELWLIPTSGSPIPAGVFKPHEGSAAVIKPPLPPGVEAKTFAITVEPEAGSPAPTSQPIMVGTRG